MDDERAAIEACLAGDKEAYKVLVEKYKVRAFYSALLYTKNRDDALDLSQEAFFRSYRALKRFDLSKNFYTWFYKILQNLCINYVKHKKSHRKIIDEMDSGSREQYLAPDIENPEEIFEKSERSAAIWKALNQLKEKDREIIILKEFNELSYQEISEILEIPMGSVMSRLYYARKKLVTRLEDYYE